MTDEDQMILVDTSVWIDSFQKGFAAVEKITNEPVICIHRFIVGEFAVDNLGNRHKVIDILNNLYHVKIIDDKDVLNLVKEKKLYGKGIGYIDCHLLASAVSMPNTLLWTHDRRLHSVAVKLGVAFPLELAQERYPNLS